MEGDGSLHRPSVEPVAAAAASAVAGSQSFDHASQQSEGLNKSSDRCASIQEIDDLQLVRAPEEAAVAVSVGVTAAAAAAAVAAMGMNLAVSGEKRKRGRPPKGQAAAGAKPPPTKKKKEEEEEDVCFICFDGGSLVLCDRKGCPKAYHPACIKRDEAFFRSKAKWNCGWHICSVCRKNAHYMCYTCTYSLCKGCTKDADYVLVRDNKGFCTTCMRTIMLIENKDQTNKEMVQVDFDDKSSWEYLFKVYWIILKERLSLSLNELTKAKNPCKGVSSVACSHQIPYAQDMANHGNGFIPNGPSEHLGVNKSKGIEESPSKELLSADRPSIENITGKTSCEKDASLIGCKEWASKELLEFVAHMKNGDTSVLSQFDVQALLLEYIKRNNLRDPRRKSEIVCDMRLRNLFGKPRVGHIEMLKLIEFHFLIKEDPQKNAFIPAGIVSTDASTVVSEENNENSLLANKNKRYKTRKKVEERVPQSNLHEYAAINVHNISLIYLRRNLMENLFEDGKFHDKVIGSIVRIRIPNSDQKQDIYRLVQVVGTSKVSAPYKVGEKTVDFMLEVLNLDKKEAITVDTISNQDFSEEECRRLRQSIRCGLVKQLTVGEIQKKAMELQAVRLNDRLEAEILKLNHLRDRASEKGRKKELRECVEKLQLLKTPEERHRRLCEIPEVHADPKMNPDYDSEDIGGIDNEKQDECAKSKHYGFSRNESKQTTTLKRKDNEGGLINPQHKMNRKGDESGLGDEAVVRSGPDTQTASLATGSSFSTSDSEAEKLWHYRDPNGKIQGPFSMVQLRKWSTTGYFPLDMRIWSINEQDDSILLTEALNCQFHTAAHLLYSFSLQSHQVVASSNYRTYKSDAGWNENINTPSRDGNQIVGAMQSSDTRVESEDRHESLRTDGFPSISSRGTASDVSHIEMQPGNSQHRELKDNNSCSDYSQVSHSLPSSNAVATHVSLPQEGQGRGSEASRSVPLDDNEASHGSAAYQTTDGQSCENKSNRKSSESQLSGQNWRSFPINLNSNIMDLNSAFSPVTKSDSSEQNGNMEQPELHSPTPRYSNQDLEGEAAEKPQAVCSNVPAQTSNVSDLPNSSPKLNNDSRGHISENRQLPSSKLGGQESGPSWGSASSLVVGGAQLPDLADEWAGYSPTPGKPSVGEWSSRLVSVSSLKQPDVVGDHATPTSNIDQLAHTSPSQPTSNASGWHAVIGPIEFSTLAEESVSDLLAEVDAMESQSGLPSPTSAMRGGDEMMKGCKNDCFSIEELSPTRDTGKSDAFNSPGHMQLPCQSALLEELFGPSHIDAYDPLKGSSRNSSTSSEGETKSSDVPSNQGGAGYTVHQRPSHSMSQNMTGATPQSSTVEAMGSVGGRVPVHLNLDWGASPQGAANVGWAASHGTGSRNPNINRSTYNGGVVWDGQRKHGGERYVAQGGDLGYGRNRPSWNKQSFGGGSGGGGGGGGGHSRPPPKGQRVCKFYESGHCKKGASCDYLHP